LRVRHTVAISRCSHRQDVYSAIPIWWPSLLIAVIEKLLLTRKTKSGVEQDSGRDHQIVIQPVIFRRLAQLAAPRFHRRANRMLPRMYRADRQCYLQRIDRRLLSLRRLPGLHPCPL